MLRRIWGRCWHWREEGPPELDELFRSFRQKIRGLWGTPEPDAVTDTPPASFGFIFFLAIAALLWAASGFYIVGAAEKAAVLRFGRYVETVGPGPHWIARGIESKTVLNVQAIQTQHYTSEMLTRDTNIVDVALSVQYRINSVKAYLFHVFDPKQDLSEATASAVRQVIGQTPMDKVLSSGRASVRQAIQETLEHTIARYNLGVEITDVNLQLAKPPQAVADAFDDAIKAHEDEKRYVNEANAYRAKIIPVAEGQAARLEALARARKQQLILKAHADTAPFLSLLPEYRRAPSVTRTRLYFDALTNVLSKNNKVLLSGHEKPVLMLNGSGQSTATTQAKTTQEPVINVLPVLTEADSKQALRRPVRPGYSHAKGAH